LLFLASTVSQIARARSRQARLREA
jgi:hypothetical protein